MCTSGVKQGCWCHDWLTAPNKRAACQYGRVTTGLLDTQRLIVLVLMPAGTAATMVVHLLVLAQVSVVDWL